MKIIKLTTPWNHSYIQQFSNDDCIFEGYKFEINNSCQEADYWIIWGGINNKTSCNVNSGKVIYITDEAYPERKFNENFLKQFDYIFAVRTDLNNRFNVLNTFEFTPWYFNKKFDDISLLSDITKTKKISIVSSDLTLLDGHKKRFAFVNKMIGHFKDKIDVFGRGFNEIEDKYDALIDYKFSIAIENNCMPNYFTEKISECFLTHTMPIYYGAPNIDKYYDQQSFIKIDIDNYQESIKIIEEVIEGDLYEKSLDKIIQSKKQYLNKYHFVPAIITYIKQIEDKNHLELQRNRYNIEPENKFEKTLIIKRAIKQIIKNI